MFPQNYIFNLNRMFKLSKFGAQLIFIFTFFSTGCVDEIKK